MKTCFIAIFKEDNTSVIGFPELPIMGNLDKEQVIITPTDNGFTFEIKNLTGKPRQNVYDLTITRREY
jgi:hypothetical protein